MKFEYTTPAADIRFLQSQDIIASSEEPAGPTDDTATDDFAPM